MLIMLLGILTKGCHFHTRGEKIIIHNTSSRDTLPRKNIRYTKSAKDMLLQYSGAALVTDADIEMA